MFYTHGVYDVYTLEARQAFVFGTRVPHPNTDFESALGECAAVL